MEDRLRNPEDFAQIATELAVDLEESIRLSEERLPNRCRRITTPPG